MANQLQITGDTKVKSLNGVLTGTSGVVGSVPLGAANGVATLDSGGKVPVSQLPSSVVTYLGTWNAATNTPTLTNGVGDAGDMYICNVAGTVNFGAGPVTFAVGDWVLYGSGTWQKSSGQNGTVTSVGATITGGAIGITGSPITTAGTLSFTFAGTSGQYVNGAGNLTTFPTLITSIGLSMPSAFSVANSPLTANGSINVTGAGSSLQYIDGTGSLQTFPTIITEAQNLICDVYNETGATLTKGTVVYINGGHGNLPTVTKALATSDATSAQTFGIVQTNITNNNNGHVVVIGNLTDLDTQAYAEGTQLYLSSTTAGAYTSVKQYAPAHLVYVAIVVRSHPTQGIIQVKIQNGFEMDELHNVYAQSPANGGILQYVTSTGLWTAVAGTTTNIAEGTYLYYTDARSRAALSFAAGSGAYNSTTGVITIPTNNNQITNGSNYITLASLSAGAGISYNNTTGVITSTITQYTNALAIAAPLTGYVSGAGTISATDSILSAIQKLNGNIGALTTGVSSVFGRTGAVVATEGDYTLTQLGDVTITSPTTGQVLKYNGTAWVNNSDTDTGITTLNTLTALTQTFAVGTSGTDFAISSATSTHTFNLPTASATNRGALSSADWSTFNSKQGTITLTTTGTSGAATLVGATLNIPNYGSALSGYVPYTGATGNVNLGVYSITADRVLTANKTNNSTLVAGSIEIQSYALNNSWVGDNMYFNGAGFYARNTGYTSQIYFQSNGDMVFLTSPTTVTAGSVSNTVARLTIASTGAATFSSSVTASSLIKSGGTSSQYLMADGSTSTLTNPVTGTGTTNYLPKFTGASTIGNSQIFDNGTNVGIGTATPTEKFDVIGGALAAGNGTIRTGITYSTLGLIGTFTNHNLGIIINGSVKATIDTSGNLGLGVTPSAWGTTSYKAIQGNYGTSFTFDQNVPTAHIVSNAYNNGTNWIYQINAPASRYATNGWTGEHIWYNAPSGTAGNAISFTQAMTLNASGNLGIGTPSASVKLEVVSSGATGSTISSYDATATKVYNQVGGTSGNQYLQLGVTASSTFINDYFGTAMTFKMADSEKMRIWSTGNVNIGTTPASDSGYKLDVNGTGRFSGALNGTSASFSSSVTTNANNYFNNTGGRAFDAISDGVLMAKNGGAHNIIFGDGNVRYYSLYTPSGAATMSIRNFSTSLDMLTFTSTGAATFSSSVNATSLYTSGTLDVGMTPAPFWNARFRDYSDGSGVYIGSVAAGGYKFIAGDSYYNNSGYFYSNNTVSSVISLQSGNFVVYTNSGLTANTNFTPTERLRIASTGAATFSSTILASSTITAGTTAGGTLYAGTVAAYQGVFNYDASGYTTTTISNTYDNANAAINFKLRTAGTSVTAMTILGSGNVGIGVTNPTSKLYVAGAGVFEGTLTTAPTGFGSGAFKIGIVQSGSASSAAGYLPIVVDGTQYYINLYNATP